MASDPELPASITAEHRLDHRLSVQLDTINIEDLENRHRAEKNNSNMSNAHGKQFTLYSHSQGPNPWKVAIVLEELGLEYHPIYIEISTGENKRAPYTDVNPNGRMPTLIDHSNNDFTIWESGAIILYLVGKYDKEHKISFADFDTTAIANQYLMFQMSGQGPYFGQATWFSKFHSEKLPSAIERYINEIRRVIGVLENIFAASGKDYLVDNKCSYADLSFIPWNWVLNYFPQLEGWEKEFPKVAAWNQRLNERESVKKCLAAKASLAQ